MFVGGEAVNGELLHRSEGHHQFTLTLGYVKESRRTGDAPWYYGASRKHSDRMARLLAGVVKPLTWPVTDVHNLGGVGVRL
jgi:hypothetical protein